MNNYYLQIGKAWHKVAFFISAFAGYMVPRGWYRSKLFWMFTGLSYEERKMVRMRTSYYIKCKDVFLRKYDTSVGTFKFPFRQKHKFSTYFFDLYNSVRYFPSRLRFNYLFGDVTYEPIVPTIVKSRPIKNGDSNSVIMKLNRVRHFRIVHDDVQFRQKKNMLVFRNIVRQPQRINFLEQYFAHPLCNAGKINKDGGHQEWIKEYMTIQEQLQYKFIACIEGNDVATNLKWVMASNSLAVMPKPKFESWFMEGKLQAGVHYVEVKEDYSDLQEKLEYYINNPDEAETIIRQAHQYLKMFLDERMERLIQLNVLYEYFHLTGQIEKKLL